MPAPTTGGSNFAHTLAAYLGVLLATSAVADQIRTYFTSVGVPERITTGVVGAIGLAGTLYKMKKDSDYAAATAVAQTVAGMPPISQGPISAVPTTPGAPPAA